MANDDTPPNDREEFISKKKITRRDVLKASGTATSAAMLGVGSAQAHAREGKGDNVDRIDIDGTTVTVSEGTNLSVTPSPDGETIVMNLQGVLFRLPGKGGHAKPLTDVELEPVRPDYASDGTRIAFEAYVAGNWDIWTMAPDGSDLRQLTDDFWDAREPKWSPDGSQIAFSSDRGEQYDIWTLDVDTGDLQQWTDDPDEDFEPTWSPDGTEIAYVTGLNRNKIEGIDQDGDTRTLVTAESGETLHSPSWSPTGEDLAYVRVRETPEGADQSDLMVSGEQVTDGEDVFVFTPDWLSPDEVLYTAGGDIRVLKLNAGARSDVPFSATFHLPELNYERKSYDFDDRGADGIQGIQTPTLSPDGEHVAFIALNDLWMMRIGQPPYRITDDLYYQTDPAWSPDGRYLAYSSDENGTTDLYIHDTQTGTNRQVTSLEEDAAVAPTWSPDGSMIAFQNKNRATLTVGVDIGEEEVKTGEIRQVTDPLFFPGQPTWSADGTTLALAALNTYSDRYDGSIHAGTNQILTVDIETGEQHYHPPGDEFDSISTRTNDGPVWSPDGQWMAFVVESTLRVMPVDETGEPAGPATQITDEATDAPTWSGDSEWLLYLNNGQLKKVRRDGSVTKEVPLPITYQPDHPTDRKVIYAGKLWDGTSPEVHEDVTIEVVNNRIQDITTDTKPPNGDYVDASDLMVIPGLWDSHVHHTYSERYFGARQGRINLAYGITATLSNADRVYRAIEEREAIASGDRVGPRYFATGEPIDGSRVHWGFIGRPTTSIEQILLEMSRAIELDYDYVKTYHRLNATRMGLVTDIAHEELGVPVESHYLAPGAFVGQNGTTHLAVSNKRFGFERTVSATSQTYDDAIKLYGQGERTVTATFFTTDFLLADEIEGDPRTQLFPPWHRKELHPPRDRKESQYNTTGYLTGHTGREDLLDAVANNTEFPSSPDCDTAVCRKAHTFKDILDCGGTVLMGTDAPLTYFGVGLHSNMRALETYALSPYETLLTATRVPAEFMGVEEDLGTVEPGKLADIVFVEGNPLEQIEDAMQVQMTMKNGGLYTIQDLVEPFKESEQDSEREETDTGDKNE